MIYNFPEIMMGPGFFMFFWDYESELEFTPQGGPPAPAIDDIDYKKEDDDIAIALSLLLARRL